MDRGAAEMALLWVLNLADSTHSMLDIADRANLPFDTVADAADALAAAGLLARPAEETAHSAMNQVDSTIDPPFEPF
jgi:hypothetical protein